MQIEIDPASRAVTVRCLYSNGEPADAEVQVYSPGAADKAYQTLRTDPRGLASFVPDGAGTWLLVVDDGMGHRVVHEVSVDADRVPALPTEPSWSPSFRDLGLAVLVVALAAWALRGRGPTT